MRTEFNQATEKYLPCLSKNTAVSSREFNLALSFSIHSNLANLCTEALDAPAATPSSAPATTRAKTPSPSAPFTVIRLDLTEKRIPGKQLY
jgi:hypothetical protein